jgi:hypothetical protein
MEIPRPTSNVSILSRITLVLLGLSAACASPEPRSASATLAALDAVDHTDGQAREPMVLETTAGALYVTGYGGPSPRLWRTADGGRTWQNVTVGTESDGAIGNSDVDLAVAPDGTLYFVAMSYDRVKYEGTGISIGVSRDNGTSWKWTALSRDRFDDRPWIDVAPDGTAHVIWNDGSGVSHAVSTDRGETWVERARIHPVGGSSHFAIGPGGELAVRITPLSASANRFDKGMDSVAISTNGGSTWTLRALPGNRLWSAFDENNDLLRWVEPVAWDSLGNLYAAWTEDSTLWLARSRDAGASWAHWKIVQDSATLYFPYLIARGNGELAMTWFSGLRESIRANVGHVTMRPGDAAPQLHRAEAFAFPSFTRADTTSTRRRDTAGEYIPVIFLRDGRIAVVTTIQDQQNRRFGFTFRAFGVTAVK